MGFHISVSFLFLPISFLPISFLFSIFGHLRITPVQIAGWKHQTAMFDIWSVASAKIYGLFISTGRFHMDG